MENENCKEFYSRKFNYKDWILFRLNNLIMRGQIIGYEDEVYCIEVEFPINGNKHLLIPQNDILKTIKMEEPAPYGVSYVADKPTDDEPENVRQFRSIIYKMLETYKAKNADYGDSFGKSIEKYGLIAALTRISDKFNRIENLILNKDRLVEDESLADSLLDLANYSIMTYMAVRNLENKEN